MCISWTINCLISVITSSDATRVLVWLDSLTNTTPLTRITKACRLTQIVHPCYG